MKSMGTAAGILMIILVLNSPASSAAIIAIEDASNEVRDMLDELEASSGGASAQIDAAKVARLRSALEQGDKIKAMLETQIKTLESEQAELVRKQAELEQVQSMLTSGLIAAVVAALGAAIGAIVTWRNSKPERDKFRIENIEKVAALKRSGIALPSAIEADYFVPGTSKSTE